MTDSTDPSKAPSRTPRLSFRDLPTWKKGLLGLSLVMMAAGGLLQAYVLVSGSSASPAGGGAGTDPALVQGLAAVDGSGGEEDQPVDDTGPGAWSPVVFRSGFSFFAGFCIAFAVRAFVRLAIIVIGLALLGLFALQYAGVIEVHWTTVGSFYDATVAWLGNETTSFSQFIRGALPSAAMAGLGLIIGFPPGLRSAEAFPVAPVRTGSAGGLLSVAASRSARPRRMRRGPPSVKPPPFTALFKGPRGWTDQPVMASGSRRARPCCPHVGVGQRRPEGQS